MEKENFNGVNRNIMRENLGKIESKDLESTIGVMVVCIKEIGSILKCMEKDSSFGPTSCDLKDNTNMERDMVKGLFIGQMEKCAKELG